MKLQIMDFESIKEKLPSIPTSLYIQILPILYDILSRISFSFFLHWIPKIPPGLIEYLIIYCQTSPGCESWLSQQNCKFPKAGILTSLFSALPHTLLKHIK